MADVGGFQVLLSWSSKEFQWREGGDPLCSASYGAVLLFPFYLGGSLSKMVFGDWRGARSPAEKGWNPVLPAAGFCDLCSLALLLWLKVD